jgi:hypothetical protein
MTTCGRWPGALTSPAEGGGGTHEQVGHAAAPACPDQAVRLREMVFGEELLTGDDVRVLLSDAGLGVDEAEPGSESVAGWAASHPSASRSTPHGWPAR